MNIKTQFIDSQINSRSGAATVVTGQICPDHQGVVYAQETLVEDQKLYSEQDVRDMLARAWDQASASAYEEGEAHGRTLGYEQCLHDCC